MTRPSGSAFKELLERYAFLAFEKQTRLSALIGERPWLLDVDKATVTFGKRLAFKAHFLGTESDVSMSWLWADANRKVRFPKDSLELCRKVRAIGQELRVAEFKADKFALDDQGGLPTGHALAMVATCLVGASAYYRGPHNKGAVYFMLSDPRIDAQPDLDLAGFSTAFNELLWFPCDLKRMLVSYLSEKGYIKDDYSAKELSCRLHTGEKVKVIFKQTKDGIEVTFNP